MLLGQLVSYCGTTIQIVALRASNEHAGHLAATESTSVIRKVALGIRDKPNFETSPVKILHISRSMLIR